MKITVSKLLLLVTLVGGVVHSAAAQTGRIALASHAGQVAETDDNFGIVPMQADVWRADTLTYVNDSLALHAGQMRSWRYAQQHEKGVWHRQVEQVAYKVLGSPSLQAIVEELRRQNPNTVFVGFEKWGGYPKKKLLKGTQLFPKRPFQYSYWRGLASAAALSAVGWLLGRKPGIKAS